MLFFFFFLIYSATANASHNMDFNELSQKMSHKDIFIDKKLGKACRIILNNKLIIKTNPNG
nr:60S ribosomal protein L22 [Ammopiptanthus mongolicus]